MKNLSSHKNAGIERRVKGIVRNGVCNKPNCLSRSFLFSALIVIIIYFAISLLKISLMQSSSNFNLTDSTALLRGESALQYHYAKIIADGERIPEVDIKAQFPEGVNTRKDLTVFMERIHGWVYFALFKNLKIPFHVYLIYFVAFFSTLSIFGVYFVTKQLWRDNYSSLIAALFYAFSTVTFSRIKGYLYEDFALPFVFFSIYFYLKAVDMEDTLNSLLLSAISGLCMFICLIGWHFSQFHFFVFVVCLLISYLVHPEKFLEDRKKYFVLALTISVLSMLNIFLAAKSFVVSVPMLTLWCGIFLLGYKHIRLHDGIKKLLFLAIVFAVLSAKLFIFSADDGSYTHVWSLFFSKIKYLAQKPLLPQNLPFDARVLWIEDFNTISLNQLILFFGFTFPLGIISGFALVKDYILKEVELNLSRTFVLLMLLIWCGLSILVVRLSVFAVFFLAIFAGRLFDGISIGNSKSKNIFKVIVLFLLMVLQAQHVVAYKEVLQWTQSSSLIKKIAGIFPPEPGRDIETISYDDVSLIGWIRRETSKDDVFLADIGISPPILAYADRNINLHPKFETAVIRDKYKQFVFGLYGTEDNFYNFCVNNGTKYFVYQMDMTLDKSLESKRYLTDNLRMKKDSFAFLAHFYPETLKKFGLVYQNDSYRIFEIKEKWGGANILPAYSPVYDPKLFEVDKSTDAFFKDIPSTLKSLREQYELLFNGINLLNKGDLTKGLRCVELASAIPILNSKVYYALGTQHLGINNIDQAIYYLSQCIKLDPFNVGALNNLAAGYEAKNDYRNAKLAFARAISVDKNFLDSYYNLAVMHYNEGNSNEALKVLAAALRIDKQNPELKSLYQEIMRNMKLGGIQKNHEKTN